MEEKKIIILDVFKLSPSDLEEKMNELCKKGYSRVFQSSIEWYQGKGDCGIICFELKDELNSK